ncbi:hypothetical protein GcM3_179033 [Golovinomyces cichoracearum]|uniref:Uncharacterized protein n=1 Tax=Golovinomyces cichoracearum TaxID=62708 RepID=A0A420HN39_9PEZI|nr:hypothetical protein GcM3_179033 [Golovinomyces cichoracearum]
MIEKIGDGMIAISKALAVPTAIDIPAQVGRTLQGQTQKLIQKSRSLTHEGTLIMLELLANPELARTYLLINDDILRRKWVTRQVQIHVVSHDVNPYFEAFVLSDKENN